MRIRRLTKEDDLELICLIYKKSWQYAYQGIIPQDYLDQLNESKWLSHLANEKITTYIVIENDVYIGAASFSSAREQKMAGWGEIVSFYLLPEYFGKGFAESLLATILEELTNEGFSNIYLWVLSDNTRARRFYEKQGFLSTDETSIINIAGKDLLEIKYSITPNLYPDFL